VQIKNIEILVHPNCCQIYTPNLPLHDRQRDLLDIWNARVEAILKDKESILIYYSFLPNSCLDTLANKYSQILKDRFIPFNFMDTLNKSEFNELFKSRGITYSSIDTKIIVYGEIFEQCVFANGWQTQLGLNIPNSNIQYCKENSLTYQDSIIIDRWKRRLMIEQIYFNKPKI